MTLSAPADAPGDVSSDEAPRAEKDSTEGTRRAWGYRPALDGVRAVAIYLVVLFHSGVRAAEGGFIGVDLFFVLSGFLITRVLLGGFAEQGRSTMLRFYARRIRRLLPAATVAIIGTCVLFVAVAPPAERLDAIGGARSAALYFSNWHFLVQAQNYFAAERLASPFLQFWSLSIEEQFYLVFPLAVLGLVTAARRLRKHALVLAGLGTLATGCLVIQLTTARSDALRAYYATPARLYQLLAGAVLAVAFERWVRPVRLARWGGISAAAGLIGLVLVASSLVSVSPSTRGILAVAASCVLIGGLELSPTSPFAAAVGAPSANYLGRISYGTYLWHWPVIIVLARVVDVGPAPTAVAAIVVGTALASLSYHLIEMPIRRSPTLDRHPRTVIVVGLAVSLITGLVIAPAILHSRRATVIPLRRAAVTDRAVDSQPVPAGIDWQAARVDTPVPPNCLGRPVDDCVLVRGKGLHIHLVGDSHAMTVLPLFEELARTRGYTFSATISGACPWQLGLVYIDNEERTSRCQAMQPDWYERVIPKLDPDVVITFNGAYDDPNFPRPVKAAAGSDASGSEADVIRRTSTRIVDRLVAEGRRVVILEPVPKSKQIDPTVCLSGATVTDQCNFEASLGPKPSETIYRYLDLLSPNVVSIDIDRVACPQYPTCVPVIDHLIVRRDRHHLTGTFARSRVAAVAKLLDASGALRRK